MSKNELIEGIKKVGVGVLDVISQKRKTSVTIEPSIIRQVVQALLEHQPRFVIIAAVDLGMDIELIYHFDVEGKLVVVRTKIAKEYNQIDTIVDLMPAAEWAEKEAAELFGINFSAHPNSGHFVLPKDWPSDKPPLREAFKGVLPEQFCPVAESLVSTGMTAPMSQLMQRKREEAGLPPSPPASFANEKSLGEVREAMKGAEFDKKAGYDWKKGKLRRA
ncbi:MAG: NADH-quinone oxidoreductase subunit C [Candidatus Hadarchaeum sp.]|jgi:Ni,Fe-hydrogenase III component G|nr:NADH-quinone oxidoreductase subunit C [Candidatus Hadarchaeum sp.]